MRVYVVRRPSEGQKYCVYRNRDDVLASEFDGAEPGDTITVELVEMAKEEVEALPDFPGW